MSINLILRSVVFCLILFTNSLANAKEINPDDVSSISFLLAAPKGAGQSSFGHAYLRFNLKNGSENSFPVVEFYAEMDGSISSYLKAVGIGTADRMVNINTFQYVIQDITVNSDRNLYSYELKIDRPTIESVVWKINQIFQHGGKLGKYQFFTSNCASAITDIFNEANIPLNGWGKGIPIQVPNVLKKNGLVSKVTVYRARSNQRKDLVLKYKYLLDKIDSPFAQSYFDIFLKGNYEWRFFAVSNLKNRLAGKYIGSLDKNEIRKLNAFLGTFSLFETGVTRKMLIGSNYNIVSEVIGSFDITDKLSHLDSRFKNGAVLGTLLSSVKTNIECANGFCFIVIQAQIRTGNRPLEFKIKIKIANLNVVQRNIIFNGKVEVGFIGDGDRVVMSGLLPVIKIIGKEGRLIVDLGMIYDLEQSAVNSVQNINNKNDINFFKNGVAGYPMCAAMTDLQKKLLENVVLDPFRTRLSAQENLQLIEEVLSGKIVVVPGFNTINEFTSSLNVDAFAKMIYRYQMDHFGSIFSAVGKWFEQDDVDSESLQTIKQWLDHGVSVPIAFRVENRGNFGHAFLLTGLVEMEDRWIVSGYDSNLGWASKLAYIRKSDLKMVTLNYGHVNFVWYGDENNDQTLDQRNLTKGKLKDFVVIVSKLKNKNSFTVGEITELL